MASDKSIILITGASNGIGYDTSYHLAAASPNYHVIMSARTPSKGEAALKEIQARNPQGTLSFLQLDVSSDESIATAAKKIEEDFGRLDVLVNNAGIYLRDATRDNLRSTFDTNVFGPLLLTHALEHLLKKSKDPRIINVSSGLGSITNRADPEHENYQVPFYPYRMSKAALNMMSTCQAFEFKEWGAKVWAYCPGYVVTDLTGKEDRENRIARGAESSETSAQGILEIIEGKRDGEVNKFVRRYGLQYPW
ncbi:short chain dehydrogenase [Lojkania enalia]|uniref:Short chain dehydrogenase n=1 Tax=Lojkania enalia TaxID=147567 RepID=A0A9P4KHJ0_9PLEO|nr:short chain dehydrogenase [Didymosphaeria enalia]